MMDKARDEFERLKAAAQLEAVKVMVHQDKDAPSRLRAIVRECGRLLREHPGLAEQAEAVGAQEPSEE